MYSCDLSVEINTSHGTINMVYPVMNASGIFCYPTILRKLAPKLGAVVTKSIGPKPREGYRPPIVAWTPEGDLVNAVGLCNPGYEESLREIEEWGYYPMIADGRRVPFIISVFGQTPDELLEVVSALNNICDAFELNYSCPNIREGERSGITIGTNPSLVRLYTEGVRRVTNKPLIVKLTPNVDYQLLLDVARAAIESGADILSAINTVFPGTPVDYMGRPILTNIKGGISGPRIKERGLEVVGVLSDLGVPIIGIGGIETAGDILEYLKAGASAVGIGTAFAYMSTQEVLNYLEGLYGELAELIRNEYVLRPATSLMEVIGSGKYSGK
ncbi:MAG: dihydroorotate dehydrogenase [Candidatus Aenigmatarchaeota archaeon]